MQSFDAARERPCVVLPGFARSTAEAASFPLQVPWEVLLFTVYEVVYGREFNATTSSLPEVSVDVGSGVEQTEIVATAREKLGTPWPLWPQARA